jgi:hypothetical protein
MTYPDLVPMTVSLTEDFISITHLCDAFEEKWQHQPFCNTVPPGCA